MSKKVGVLFIHGMGDTKADFHIELENELKKRLGDKAQAVQFQSCYWQPILQKREEILWEKMLSKNSNMDKKKMRKWIINAGWWPISESPLSHNLYWTDNDLTKPVTRQIKEIVEIIF